MEQEKVLRVCNGCGVIQEKIQHGKFNTKDKRWRDMNGHLWSGNNCPACHKNRMRIYQQMKRATKKTEGI